jgi:biotin synthase-like enzyme
MQRVSIVAKGLKNLKNNRYLSSNAVRNDWTKNEIQDIYDMPLMDLVFRASSVHRQYFNSQEVQQV